MTLQTPTPNFLITSKELPSPLSEIKIKVQRTGQRISSADSQYVQIYRVNERTYRLAYTFYFTLTRLKVRIEDRDGKVAIQIEDYLQGPVFPTLFDVQFLDKTVIGNLDQNSIGLEITIEPSKVLKPATPSVPTIPAKIVREGPLKRIVHVGTFGVQCGIATYLENLMDRMIPLKKEIEQIVFAEKIPPGDTRSSSGKDYKGNQPSLMRNWIRNQPVDQFLKDLSELNPDILHIQHEWAFFTASSPIVLEILRAAKQKGTCNIITWHTVYGRNEADSRTLSIFFREVKPIVDIHIVHEINSYNNLVSFNIEKEKIRLIPMSAYAVRDIEKEDAKRKMLPEKYWGKKIIVTGGFLLPNKGVEKIILAMSTLNIANLALICIGGSHPWSEQVYKEYYNLVVQTAKQTGVDLYLDYRFMDDEEIAWYMACADINILYYGWTLSGTSGWSRRAIASKRPIICTDVKLMSDLQHGIHCLKIPPKNIPALREAIKTLLEDKDLGEKLSENAAKYAQEISHEKMSKRLIEVYQEVYKANVSK